MDAQADLNLRWAQRSFCWFCHKAAHFGVWTFSSLLVGAEGGLQSLIVALLPVPGEIFTAVFCTLISGEIIQDRKASLSKWKVRFIFEITPVQWSYLLIRKTNS